MTIIELIYKVKNILPIKKVIIWNPNTSKVLYVGYIDKIPEIFKNKKIKEYFYSREKERIIIRV